MKISIILSKSKILSDGSSPLELWSEKITAQKVDYIHNNPVEAGFVKLPEHWKFSSANPTFLPPFKIFPN